MWTVWSFKLVARYCAMWSNKSADERGAGSLVPKSSTESRAASASEIVLIRAAGRAGSKAATPGTQ